MVNKARINSQKRMMARANRLRALRKQIKKFAVSPRDKWKTRAYNRCEITGRPRNYMRDFGISGATFRQLAEKGELAGVKKSSW